MEDKDILTLIKWGVGITAGLTVLMLGGCPVYKVWSARLDGEAVLAHAHAARMVAVTQAQAELEAAGKRAQAIQIVGKAAQDFPEYREQEFIGAFAEALKEGKMQQIIYVPTEANIPIIERHRGKEGK